MSRRCRRSGANRRRAAADARHRQPGVDRLVRRPRPRARAHAARRDLDRDVGGAQLVLPARSGATTCRRRCATGPYSVYQEVKERCALFWGLRRPHDAARRGAGVPRGRRPDRGGRHGAADARVVAIPAEGALEATTRTRPRRWRCCRRSAAFRPTGARCRFAPTSSRWSRFLLFDSAYPGRSRRRSTRCAPRCRAADAQPRSSPPVLRLERLIADLELQRRAPEASGALAQTLEQVQEELGARRPRHRRALLRDRRARRRRAPLDELRDPLPDRLRLRRDVVDNLNALRVKPAGNGRQRCDEFNVRLTPEVRLHRHTDYFGTEVVEFEVSQPHRRADDRRARARRHQARRPTPPQATWEALREPGYREAGGEFLLQTDDAAGARRCSTRCWPTTGSTSTPLCDRDADRRS